MKEMTYQGCMSKELKGNLAGKSKATRERLFKEAAKKCSKQTKSKAKSNPKPKSKSKPKEKVKTTTTKKKEPLKKRRRGPFEKKVDKSIIEWADFRRALRVPVNQTHFKFVGGTWRIRIGPIKIKRQRLADAMRDLRKRVKKRI